MSKAISSLSAQMERVTEAYLAGAFSLEEYRHRRQDLEQRVADLDNQRRLFEGQARQQIEVMVLCTSITSFCQRISAGLEYATFEQKRQLVELLIDRIVVTMEEVEIHYVIPTSSRSEHICFYHLRTAYLRDIVATVVRSSADITQLLCAGRVRKKSGYLCQRRKRSHPSPRSHQPNFLSASTRYKRDGTIA
jgi:hypothetical protein